ncbi:MAG: 16S rRNA (uracil(1498)-N(3))-methyltransferase [Bacteroidetes bacterium]|nr:16S rRNA (uracil(1498)-N(3))-methyltransferase [Bacteroidota bacterium]
MNIILAESHEVIDGKVFLRDHRAKHIVKVLGSKIGDQVKFGIIDGMRGRATILSLETRFPFLVELEVELYHPPKEYPFVDLLLAFPRPIMLKRILSQAAALGVGKFFVTNANRVEKSFWDAGLLNPGVCREHLIQGLEQSVDTRVPEVEFHRYFRKFIEKILPSKTDDYSHLLLAHPEGEKRLKDRITEKPGRILLAIGPEGGWVDFEVEKFKKCGFSSFTTGDRILKVDTAVVALHGQVSAVKDWFV